MALLSSLSKAELSIHDHAVVVEKNVFEIYKVCCVQIMMVFRN